jgi:ATP-binding cassette subfamily B protein
MSLLLRLQDPVEGSVRVDGHDLRDLTLESVRSQIAIVLQESVLFATSVRENIAYGRLGSTDEEIEAAARLANAHGFIQGLPEGYETVLGERGATLSGGQRQRIAVARAAVRDARIVVLDEATAGLDEANASEVVAALDRLTAGRTTFVIAHDLAAAGRLDRVVVVERGRIIDQGCPADVAGRILEASGAHPA